MLGDAINNVRPGGTKVRPQRDKVIQVMPNNPPKKRAVLRGHLAARRLVVLNAPEALLVSSPASPGTPAHTASPA